MEDRVRSCGSFGDNALPFVGSLRERVRRWSFVDPPRPIPIPIPVAGGMIPFEAIYCQNEEDPTSLEPFEVGSHVSIYHSLLSRNGLEKPTCLDITASRAWLRSRPDNQDVVPFPIADAFVFYVNKTTVLRQLGSRAIGFRPLFIDNRRVLNIVESVYQFIPFIPPNYPLNSNSNVYPYDSITVRSPIRPYFTMAIRRNVLVNRIHEQYSRLGEGTTPIPIVELNDINIQVDHISHGRTQLNSLDVISNPRHRQFKIHSRLRTIVRL
jgi:hypothetical protein